ncbi:hypothetical protein [Lewinella cohaerens]|uniref:hypothetical protein n=1 Tax=Lewinella cohaerens TaxID=70995 RepID=UPI00036FFBFF|nr:hypothetical protein [Lewinella cohaerens]
MPKQKTDDLLQLILSLTRAEKRHFRLFVKRNQSSNDILFLQLFDHLDKHQEYDEPTLLKKIPDIKKTQLSNLKAHLYKQLLTSLRLLSKNYNEDIEIREAIDYARVLYNKGLYQQALDILDKAKQKARLAKFDTLTLEILEFEKRIEGQYVTGSMEGRADALSHESAELTELLHRTNQFSNLSLQMYALYLKVGYVRNQKEYDFARATFEEQLPDVDYHQLDFWSKVYHSKAHYWYHHMRQDFPQCFRYSERWLALFDNSPNSIRLHPAEYLKGLHKLLNALFNTLQYQRFCEVMQILEAFPDQYDMSKNKNIEGLYYLFWYIHQIKFHFLQGTFTEGIVLVEPLMKIIEEETYYWDNRRVLVFYYRIACLYFGSGNNSKAIDYLNLIINQKNPDYREDIQSFARILNLIAHFELGNRQLVEYQVKSVYRFLAKQEELNEVQKEIFYFIRKTPRIRTDELQVEFVRLKETLSKLEGKPFVRRPFLYLDIISWLESKIEGVPVQEVIRRKFVVREEKS